MKKSEGALMRELINNNHLNALARDKKRVDELKKHQKQSIVIMMILTVLTLTSMLVIYNQYTEAFKRCDAAIGRACTPYEMRINELKEVAK